jgi:uncharacterized phage infection (PIP) family protein YhgE
MGCRNFAVGCGIFALITVAALGIGGFWLYQQFGPTVQAYIAFGQKVESTLNGISDVSTNLNSNNGKNTFVIGARVPFDPNDLTQAEQTAQKIATLAKQLPLPANAKVPNLEVKLYRDVNGGKSEHTFKFDLSKPLPQPERPKL